MDKRPKYLVVMGAGSGIRMGAALPKQFLDLGGEPVLRRTIRTFLSAVPGIRVVTVLPADYLEYWRNDCIAGGFDGPQTLVKGGITRFHSVRNALSKVPEGAIVAIHDAVRPLVSVALVRSMFARMEEGTCRALIPVIPSVDTLKVLDRTESPQGEGVFTSSDQTLDRTRVFGAQTPQLFRSEDIRAAYAQAYDTSFTDDASVAAKKGIPLSFCDGERNNFKLTSREDLALARLIISSFSPSAS